VRLHAEGLIYRGKRLVNWDPVLLTALSDLEVQAQEEDGQLWHVRYPLADGAGQLVVATTRPETILGDAAVAVHPQDPRYQELIGRQVLVPLADRAVPVIADAYVDPAFGTGCLKVTPAHDFNDYDIGQRHHLPLINIFTPRRHARRHRTAAFPRTRALRGPQTRAGGTRGRRTHRARRQAPAGSAARGIAAARCSSLISPTSGS